MGEARNYILKHIIQNMGNKTAFQKWLIFKLS